MPISVDPRTDAVIVVDVQRDFCPGGALAVPRGNEVVPVINRLLVVTDWLTVATRDWHPAPLLVPSPGRHLASPLRGRDGRRRLSSRPGPSARPSRRLQGRHQRLPRRIPAFKGPTWPPSSPGAALAAPLSAAWPPTIASKRRRWTRGARDWTSS